MIASPAAWTFGPNPTSQHVNYAAPAGITLAQIAANWGLTPADIAEANADVPALFSIGVEIAYPNKSVTTQGGDTFTTLAGRAGAPNVGAFASDASVSGFSDLIATGALFIASVSLVRTMQPDTASKTWTVGALASDLNVPLADFADANGALVGLLTPGITYGLAGPGPTLRATTGQYDTLHSLA